MKKVIATKNAPGAIGPYSQAIEVNGMLFISGQIPINPATGNIVEGGIYEQTEQVMKNLEGILTEAGYTFDDVVKSTCLLLSFQFPQGLLLEVFSLRKLLLQEDFVQNVCHILHS